jgi:hypothetical protein
MKRLAGIFLHGVIALVLFSACRTVEESSTGVDLTREVDRLQGLYREAVRVPITPQIVNQIRREEKDYLLAEIRYFTSINIALMHSRAGESSMGLENKELPRVRRGGPLQGSPAGSGGRTNQNSGNTGPSSTQDAAPRVSIEFQEIPILTFKEGGSSLDQRRITSDDEGHLKDLSPEGNVFEILYPDRGLVLGFTLNREENWYDLEFAVDENTGERTSLAMTGARPHLMINYQAIFPFGETRIQMDKTLRPPAPTAGSEPWQPPLSGSSESNPPQASLAPPETPADIPAESPPDAGLFFPPVESIPLVEGVPSGVPLMESTPPAESIAENPPLYPEEGIADKGNRGNTEDFYLEEAPPTAWEDQYEDLYLGDRGGEGPEVDVVLLTEKSGPSSPDPAAPVPAVEKTVPVPVETALSGLGRYIIQVGAFREKRNASAAFAALEGAGFCPLYEPHQGLTRVLIPAVERADLARVREKVRALGLGEPYVRQ